MAISDQFHPCRTGIHIMRLDDTAKYGPHVTLANYELSSEDALKVFEAVRPSFDDPESDEMLADLMVNGDMVDAFCFRHQMLVPLRAMIEAQQ
jgi:hypothetical protein